MNDVTISELASRVFQSRDAAHREHWATKSYAAHVALGVFYDGSIDAIDAVIENYQGLFGKIDPFEVRTVPVKDIAKYLQDESDWIESNMDALSQGSPSIGNLIQALVSVYTKSCFMLSMK
jgi:hypothetical protein